MVYFTTLFLYKTSTMGMFFWFLPTPVHVLYGYILCTTILSYSHIFLQVFHPFL